MPATKATCNSKLLRTGTLSSAPGGRARTSVRAGPVRLMSTAIVVVMTRSMAKNCRSPRLVLTCGRQEDRDAEDAEDEPQGVPCPQGAWRRILLARRLI